MNKTEHSWTVEELAQVANYEQDRAQLDSRGVGSSGNYEQDRAQLDSRGVGLTPVWPTTLGCNLSITMSEKHLKGGGIHPLKSGEGTDYASCCGCI